MLWTTWLLTGEMAKTERKSETKPAPTTEKDQTVPVLVFVGYLVFVVVIVTLGLCGVLV